MNYSVIRAADTPLGRSWAKTFASRHKHLILLGIDKDKLEQTSLALRHEYQVQVASFVVDESRSEDIINTCGLINDHFDVDALVNCQESDPQGNWLDQDIFSLDRNLKIAFIASPLYAHQLRPNLSRFFNALILNVNTHFPGSFAEEILQAGVILKNTETELPLELFAMPS